MPILRDTLGRSTTPRHVAIDLIIEALEELIKNWRDMRPGLEKWQYEDIEEQLHKIIFRLVKKCLQRNVVSVGLSGIIIKWKNPPVPMPEYESEDD